MVLSSAISVRQTLENYPLRGWGQIVKVSEEHDRFFLSYHPTSRHLAGRGVKRFNLVRCSSIGYQFDSSMAVVDGESSSQHAVFRFASVLQDLSLTTGLLL